MDLYLMLSKTYFQTQNQHQAQLDLIGPFVWGLFGNRSYNLTGRPPSFVLRDHEGFQSLKDFRQPFLRFSLFYVKTFFFFLIFSL